MDISLSFARGEGDSGASKETSFYPVLSSGRGEAVPMLYDPSKVVAFSSQMMLSMFSTVKFFLYTFKPSCSTPRGFVSCTIMLIDLSSSNGFSFSISCTFYDFKCLARSGWTRIFVSPVSGRGDTIDLARLMMFILRLSFSCSVISSSCSSRLLLVSATASRKIFGCIFRAYSAIAISLYSSIGFAYLLKCFLTRSSC